MATSSTFYLNGPSLGASTAIFSDINLTVCSADGFYSDGTIVREQVDCSLLPQSTCPSCTEGLTIDSSVPSGGAGTLDFTGGQAGEVLTLSFDIFSVEPDPDFVSLVFSSPVSVASLDSLNLTRIGTVTLNGSGNATSNYLFDLTTCLSACVVKITARSSGLAIPVDNSTNIIN
jgi:hypothetical protein